MWLSATILRGKGVIFAILSAVELVLLLRLKNVLFQRRLKMTVQLNPCKASYFFIDDRWAVSALTSTKGYVCILEPSKSDVLDIDMVHKVQL